MAAYTGSVWNDFLIGSTADDVLTGLQGNDTLVGGAGTDTVVFQGNRSDYLITRQGNTLTINDRVSGRDQTDIVSEFEKFQFADFTVNSMKGLTKTWISDFNGDGRSDFYWRSGSSENANDHIWNIRENNVVAKSVASPTSITSVRSSFFDASVLDLSTTSTYSDGSDGVMDFVVISSDRQTINYRVFDSVNDDFTYEEKSHLIKWQIRQYMGHGDINGDEAEDYVFSYLMGDTWEAVLGGDSNSLTNAVDIGSIVNRAGFTPYVGDMNADGVDDVMARTHSIYSSRSIIFAYMLNGEKSSTVYVQDPGWNWEITGIHDFDGNGSDDIMFRHRETGDVVQWAMSSEKISGSAIGNVGKNWKLQGAGDFNGDGTEDLLWKHSETGMVVNWLMDGETSQGNLLTESQDSAISFQGVGDYDGNGKADVVWRNNSTNEVFVWFMDGGSFSQYTVGAIAAGYTLVTG